MVEGSRGAVADTVLVDLLAPSPEVPLKRVTLAYRPHTAAEARRGRQPGPATAIGRTGARPLERSGGEPGEHRRRWWQGRHVLLPGQALQRLPVRVRLPPGQDEHREKRAAVQQIARRGEAA